jgi:hypothetical protein
MDFMIIPHRNKYNLNKEPDMQTNQADIWMKKLPMVSTWALPAGRIVLYHPDRGNVPSYRRPSRYYPSRHHRTADISISHSRTAQYQIQDIAGEYPQDLADQRNFDNSRNRPYVHNDIYGILSTGGMKA